METFYFLISPSITIIYYIVVSDIFFRAHKNNLNKYKPVIYPQITFFSLIGNSFLVFMLTFMFNAWSMVLSKNPLIFIPLGLAGIGLLSYFMYRKYVITYFTDSKIIFWHPGVFKSSTMEAEIKNLEALIFAENDEVAQVMAKGGNKKFCFVNLNFDGQKKSVSLDLEKYDGQKVKAFFTGHNIPVYSKFVHEKTANRIN